MINIHVQDPNISDPTPVKVGQYHRLVNTETCELGNSVEHRGLRYQEGHAFFEFTCATEDVENTNEVILMDKVQYCIQQNFCWLKISPKGSYFVLGQNFTKFNFTNRANYLPGSCGWSSQVAMHICTCARECVKIFTVQKIRGKNFHRRHALAKRFPGENSHIYGIIRHSIVNLSTLIEVAYMYICTCLCHNDCDP